MKLHDLDPVTYRNTELVDLYLGRKVREALEEGKASAKQAHEADEAMQRKIAQMKQGRVAC